MEIIFAFRNLLDQRFDFFNKPVRHTFPVNNKPSIARVQIQVAIRTDPVKSHRQIPLDCILFYCLIICVFETFRAPGIFFLCQFDSSIKYFPQVIYIISLTMSIPLESIESCRHIIDKRNSREHRWDFRLKVPLRCKTIQNCCSALIRNTFEKKKKNRERVNIQ